MNCPNCGGESEVIDSRPVCEGAVVRRRRRCISARACSGENFSTYEIPARDAVRFTLTIDLMGTISAQRGELAVKLQEIPPPPSVGLDDDQGP